MTVCFEMIVCYKMTVGYEMAVCYEMTVCYEMMVCYEMTVGYEMIMIMKRCIFNYYSVKGCLSKGIHLNWILLFLLPNDCLLQNDYWLQNICLFWNYCLLQNDWLLRNYCLLLNDQQLFVIIQLRFDFHRGYILTVSFCLSIFSDKLIMALVISHYTLQHST